MNALNTELALQIISDNYENLSEHQFFLFQELFVNQQEEAGMHPNDVIELLNHISFLMGLIY